MLLLEPRESNSAARIEAAAREAGLSLTFLDSIEAAPRNATLIGVGPSIADAPAVARHLRTIGSQALLVFFITSTSARDALQAELVRDPFLYRRVELIELPGSVRQLASRMGQVVSSVKRQLHTSTTATRRQKRTRGLAPPARVIGNAEHVLAHVLGQSRDAIVMTDETGRITTWNAAAQRMFGFTAERALGRGIHLLDSDDRETRFSALVNQVLQIGEPIEAQVVCADAEGKHVQVGVSLAPIRDTHGAVLGTSIVMRDDAEYNRVQEALREANRQKDEFLAIMSHELRTPLTSILGYTDMLMRGLSGPLAPMTNKYVGNVRAAGDRLLELVNGLLDYTRLEAGVERLDVKPVDLVKLADQVVQNCQSMARSKGVELRMATSSGIQARVDVDEQRVVHVLRSLVNNAVKFTPTGGSVNVVVDIDEERANAVRVSVHDSGIGLREDQIGRVWDRFYQGDLSLTRPYGGMGLGLSIARHLVTLHGGTVGAESRGPGRGSTFWFSLPLAS